MSEQGVPVTQAQVRQLLLEIGAYQVHYLLSDLIGDVWRDQHPAEHKRAQRPSATNDGGKRMIDPDIQTAHDEALRQIWGKFEADSRRDFQAALDEYDRTMRRALAVYAIVILLLLTVIVIHLSWMPTSAIPPT